MVQNHIEPAADACCQHEHEHHHHHDHDHCCCGHDHHHDHHEEAGHSARGEGHDHHSHSEERTMPWKGGVLSFSSRLHEGASVGSVRWEGRSPDGGEEEALSAIMRDTAQWVTENQGFIGHIKASLERSEYKSFSITQEELSVTPGGVTIKAGMTAIVFGICPEEVEKRLVKAFQDKL